MKGIILAGGSGSRLYPLTKVTSKQLLPVYDKPMIYYPLSVLLRAGIKDILIISTPEDIPRFRKLFGDGKALNVRLRYAEQKVPNGLAQAFIIGKKFIKKDCVAMILGDNIFYGDFDDKLKKAVSNAKKGYATIFGYRVNDPKRFGILEFDKDGKVVSIEEKPQNPKSDYCVTGLYFYDDKVVEYAKRLKPSYRNEYEITDLNNIYLKSGKLKVELLDEKCYWIDAGTHESLYTCSDFIRKKQIENKRKIACIEEVCFDLGLISNDEMISLCNSVKDDYYRAYLLNKIKDKESKK